MHISTFERSQTAKESFMATAKFSYFPKVVLSRNKKKSMSELKVRKSRKQIMLPWILQKNVRWISALEDYYIKVSTKESLSSCKKKIDSLLVLTLNDACFLVS